MAQWVEAPGTNTYDLSRVLGIHTVEEENQLPGTVPLTSIYVVDVPAHTCSTNPKGSY